MHQNYLQNSCIWVYNSCKQVSNLLKHILNVRDKILAGEGSIQAAKIKVKQWVINGKFNSKVAYEFFSPQKLPHTWPKLVWHSSIVPRHSFIFVDGSEREVAEKGQSLRAH